MKNNSGSLVETWSMDDIPSRERYDYYLEKLAKAVTPMRVECPSPKDFEASMRWANLGSISVLQLAGHAHTVVRGKREVERSQDRTFHLILDVDTKMNINHCSTFSALPGDAILVDSQLGHEVEFPQYDHVHVRLPEAFVKQWVPLPGALVGKNISAQSGWGAALCAFVRQLSPEFVANTPLPQSLIADQLGALLALTSTQFNGPLGPGAKPDRSLYDRIVDCMAQRCMEVSVTAGEVAQSIGISPRTLHRILAAKSETFGYLLMRKRADAALRMLASQQFKLLTIAEIGRRAGFLDASHFVRVFKSHVGATPTEIRRGTVISAPVRSPGQSMGGSEE